MPTVKPGVVPGDAMTEQDVIREVSGSRRGLVLAVAAIVVLAVVAVVGMMIRGRPRSPAPPPAPAASAIPATPAEAATNSAAAVPPDSPARTAKGEQKVVATPPSGKRSDGSDKRASRRKNTGARKRK